MAFKKGQHLVCRFKGDNGDLVVGRVDSVRAGGTVLLVDLLTESPQPRVKQASILAERNVEVSKMDALRVVRRYQAVISATGVQAEARAAARALAVDIAATYKTREAAAVPGAQLKLVPQPVPVPPVARMPYEPALAPPADDRAQLPVDDDHAVKLPGWNVRLAALTDRQRIVLLERTLGVVQAAAFERISALEAAMRTLADARVAQAGAK